MPFAKPENAVKRAEGNFFFLLNHNLIQNISN